MTEHLHQRVRRLISGSINGLVDAFEVANAETVMREALREIERAADDIRAELGQVIAQRHHNDRMIERIKSKRDELTQRAQLAVEQRRDDLAEAAISRCLDLEAQIPVLDTASIELSGKCRELEGYVAALAARKREMERDLAAHVEAKALAACASSEPIAPGLNVANKAERRAEQAQNAFDRARGSAQGVPGPARAERETLVKLGELERLERSSKIAERLASLKQSRMAG
jgi:phage shock protein A